MHNSNKQADTAPANFNAVVLPHVDTSDDPYPPKFMKYVLNDLVGVRHGKFLDLGGGWGAHTRIAASMGFDVVSVDREPAAEDVPSLVCDIAVEPLPLEDNSVDVVFSKSFIEHFYVRELPHILGEVSRVLKPGGVCIFLTPDWAFNTKQFYQIFTHVTPYTRSSIEQCLKMYGFEEVWSKSLIQLPQVWDNKFMEKLAEITSHLPIPRSAGKWVRWSKERYLMGVGRKPFQ